MTRSTFDDRSFAATPINSVLPADAPHADNDAVTSPNGPVVLPCVHCGEPTECSSDHDPRQVFCCNGCQAAYQLIQGWGLGDFYALRDQMRQSGAARAADQGVRYEQFDSPEFLGPSAPVERGSTCSTELAVHGLHCGACAWLIENAVQHEPGLLSARVKMSQHTIQLVYDSKTTKLSHIARFLDRLGYQLAPFDPARDTHVQTENRRLLIQIAIAGFLAANAMWIAVALYAGDYSGVEVEHSYFMGLVGTALGVVAVAGPGRTFFVGALASLKTRTPHMDLPVALGLSVGTIVGSFNAIVGRGHVYFDSLATLVFLLLIGRWIQFRQQQSAAKSVDLMLRITPRHAELTLPDGTTKTVLAETLMADDVIRVNAGDSLAADGIIVAGATQLDRSLLTGESLPIKAECGDAVSAGVLNLTEAISVRVTATGRESRIGRVMQAVEAATTERTPVILLADRIGGYFVVAVTILAIVTFVAWFPSSLSIATSNATSLLIVACPCALALATPLAIAVGLGRAARSGILIRDGRSLQRLSQSGRMWFDKTGTLTEGKQRVTSLHGDPQQLAYAAALEEHCRHPVAEAVLRAARQHRLTTPTVDESPRLVQGGIVGQVAGQMCRVGNCEMLLREGVEVDEQHRDLMQQMTSRGESPLFIAVNQVVTCMLGVSDPLRSGAVEALGQLRRNGWRLGILSGDHPDIVARIAAEVGVEPDQAFGGLTPEEKLAAIRESRSGGRSVAMVGDGANDAAALAAADVGIAVRGGAEVSLQAAPVFVASGRLPSVVDLVVGSRRTTRLIVLTFGVSLAYNLIAVALAMAGVISPLLAAVLMPLSSVSVLALTLALKTFPNAERSFGER